MKKLVFLLFGIIVFSTVYPQETPSKELKPSDDYHLKTIFNIKKKPHKKIPLGYFIELNGAYTRFSNVDVLMSGLSAGIILNHNWSIGLTGSFIGNSNHLFFNEIYYSPIDSIMHGAYFGGGYGGLLVEYTLFPRSIIHISFPLMIGAGYMYWLDDLYFSTNYWANHYWTRGVVDQNKFFVIEPGFRAEFNVLRKLRLGIGISYRYTPKINLITTPKTMINTFNAKISLRFGKF